MIAGLALGGGAKGRAQSRVHRGPKPFTKGFRPGKPGSGLDESVYRRGEVGQTARALRLLDALRGFKHGRTLEDLAARLGVSERTVRRDLEELADADVRLELSRVDGRAAARLVEASYTGVPVTRRERYTLLAARRVFDVLRGTSFHEDAVSVLAKFEQTMNATERKEHGALVTTGFRGDHFHRDHRGPGTTPCEARRTRS